MAAITATVRINNLAGQMEGSGVLIGKSGPFVYILTAEHVVKGADRLEVSVFFRGSYPKPKAIYRSAEILAQTRGLADLAVLRLATTDVMPGFVPPCPKEGLPSAPKTLVLAVGCAGGRAPTCWPETFAQKKSARRKDGETGVFWEVERTDASGRSGGPLIDAHGFLVGVCSGCKREKTYFTHIEEIHRFLNRNGFRWLLEENGKRRKNSSQNGAGDSGTDSR